MKIPGPAVIYLNIVGEGIGLCNPFCDSGVSCCRLQRDKAEVGSFGGDI